MNEFSLIEKIKKIIPRRLQGKIGIGDDAGVFSAPRGEALVFATDTIVEGVDFLRGSITPENVGRKALAINLSDMAAMGAKPLACVIALGIPKNLSESWLLRFYKGLTPLAKQYRVSCIGGDISRASEFFASVAVIGSAREKEIVRRSGARPGDWIAVTGALGGSILKHHYAFTPRLAAAQFLAKNYKPTSMIDISDGLLQDLEHLLKNSGTGARLEMSEIPITQDAVKLAGGHPMKALERACTDGEDFELLFTMPAAKKNKLDRAWKKKFPRLLLNWIGRMEKGNKIRWTLKGKPVPAPKFKKKGYRHF